MGSVSAFSRVMQRSTMKEGKKKRWPGERRKTRLFKTEGIECWIREADTFSSP